MNKVKDLVSVNVATATRLFGAEERYELLSYVVPYIRDLVVCSENCGRPPRKPNYVTDLRYEPFLASVYENFYMGASAMTSIKFSPPGTECTIALALRAQKAASALMDTPIIREYDTRVWEEDEFMADCFCYLWMRFFMDLSGWGQWHSNDVPKGQGGIP